MASATNPSPPSLSTSQSPSSSVAQNLCPTANEEAVRSDSSLSQNNPHSIRSTPASSFSAQRPSPNSEAQCSTLQPVREIELSNFSSHEDPGQSDGTNAPQQDGDEANQYRNPSSTLTGEHVGVGNTLQPPHRQRTYAESVQGSLRTVYEHLPTYEVTSNSIALLALALTAFFGYETYQLTRESNTYQRLDYCSGEKVLEKHRESCKTVLEKSLPHAASVMRRVLDFLPRHKDTTDTQSSKDSFPQGINQPFVFLGLGFSIGLLIDTCTGHWLTGGLVKSVQRLRRRLRYNPDTFDPVHWLAGGLVKSVQRLRRRFRYRPDAFDAVHVRLTHPQVRTSSADLGVGSQAGQSGGRRRIIPGIHEQTYEDYDRGRKRSFQPHFEALLSVPFWKRRSLGSLQTTPEIPAPVRRASTEIAASIGDALKGTAPDDLVLSPGAPSHLLHRVLQKIPILHYNDSDDDDIEPPLTALLADWKPDQNTERKVAITSGVVALGLAQAGSTLASSVGGCIGPDILVRSESIDEMMNLTPLPTSQDTVATGVER